MLLIGNMLHNSYFPHDSTMIYLLFIFQVVQKPETTGAVIMALMMLPLIGSVSVSESLVSLMTVCLVYLIIRFFRTEIPKGLRRPPGPKFLPIIGNVLEVGSNPHLSLSAMSKRYGDVFQIQLGMRPVIVLSGIETVRQALIKHGDDFASRPDLYSFKFINDGKSLTFSTDKVGVWRARRKLAYSALRSFSTLESKDPEYSCMLEEHICKEGEYLMKQMNSVMTADGSFDPYKHIVISVANVICGICFGRRYDHNHQELVNLVTISDEFTQVTGSGNPADFIPILRFLPSTTMKRFLDINARFTSFVQKIICEHYATFDKVQVINYSRELPLLLTAYYSFSATAYPSRHNVNSFVPAISIISFRTTFVTSLTLSSITVRTGSWMRTPMSRCQTKRL